MRIRLIFLFFCLCFLSRFGVKSESLPVASSAAGGPRVVMVEDREAVVAFQFRADKVRAMVDRGLLKLTGSSNVVQGWRTLVSTQDVIGIKVASVAGGTSGTRPAVAASVIEGLIEAGVPSTNIVIWDRHLADLRAAGFSDLARRLNVRLAGSVESGYNEAVSYESPILGTLVWGDLEYGRKDAKGRKSYVSKLLTGQFTKIITIAPLFNHNLAGVNGCLCSLALSSVDNSARFEIQSDRLAKAVPEIYAMEALSDHVVLNMIDALIAQYDGEQVSLLHYSTELNQVWLSKDPVALDSLAIQTLSQERENRKMAPANRNPALYETAAFIELGVCDLTRIRVEMAR